MIKSARIHPKDPDMIAVYPKLSLDVPTQGIDLFAHTLKQRLLPLLRRAVKHALDPFDLELTAD